MRQAKKTLVSVSVMLAAAMALPFAGVAFAQGEEIVEAEVVETEDAQEPVEVEPCLDASCDEQAVETEEAPAPAAEERQLQPRRLPPLLMARSSPRRAAKARKVAARRGPAPPLTTRTIVFSPACRREHCHLNQVHC
jgi:hypothetical protein